MGFYLIRSCSEKPEASKLKRQLMLSHVGLYGQYYLPFTFMSFPFVTFRTFPSVLGILFY